MPQKAELDSNRLLSSNAFSFELDVELRRAVRSRAHITLVVLRASRDPDGQELPLEPVVQDIARIVGSGVRETDLIGTDAGSLIVALIDTDLEHGTHVIERLMSAMEAERFNAPVRIAVGAACYPEDAVDGESLKREAIARPVVNWRAVQTNAAHN